MWGVSRCDFCGSYLDDVLEKSKQILSLDYAIVSEEAFGNEFDRAPHYGNGDHGSVKGCYIKRRSKQIFGPDWMSDLQGRLMSSGTS